MTDTPQGAWMREYEERRELLEWAIAEHTVGNEYAIAPGLEPPTKERDAARAALDAHVRGLVEALEHIAASGCEHIHGGDCWVKGYHSSNYTLDSDEWATRICNPCAARAALTTPKDAP